MIINIRKGSPTPADALAFTGLFNSTYLSSIDPSYYTWQIAGPQAPGSFLFMELDGKVVASCGLRVHTCKHSEILRAGLLVDLIVVPEFRGRGLVKEFGPAIDALAKENHCDFLYATSNLKGFKSLTSRLGWVPIGSVDTYVVKNISDGLETSLTFTLVEEFGPEFDVIQRNFELTHAGMFVNQRTRGYLAWRFSANPRYTYTVFLARESEQPYGYLVLKTYTSANGSVAGDIADIMWAEDRMDHLRSMLYFSILHFASLGIHDVCTWLNTNTVLDGIARMVGFEANGQKRHLSGRPITCGLPRLDHWFLNMADSEVY